MTTIIMIMITPRYTLFGFFTWQNLTVKVINLCFRCYVSGRLDGTAKYYYTSGAIESRMYENGVLQVIDNNCDDEHVGKTIFSL